MSPSHVPAIPPHVSAMKGHRLAMLQEKNGEEVSEAEAKVG
jgi:hypothetical protein